MCFIDNVDCVKSAFLTAVGLPGSGKSSVMRELAQLYEVPAYFEPDSNWPPAVTERDTIGAFSAMMWFRSIRVPYLYKADSLRKQNKSVIVDSYYDKIFSYCLGKKGMEWLITPDDPYYSLALSVAKQDTAFLPNADCIVLFDLSEDTWRKLLKSRNRFLDDDSSLLSSYKTQAYFFEGAYELSRQYNIKVIEFTQEFSSPKEAAKKLYKLLKKESIL